MNPKQAIQENPVLKKVAALFNIKSFEVDIDIDVTDKQALQTYVAYVREHTLRTLVTLVLIQAKLNRCDESEINQKIADTLEQALQEQTRKGLEKYPNTVNPADYDIDGWLNHAIQELVDTTVYETCLIELLRLLEAFANDTTATAKKATT